MATTTGVRRATAATEASGVLTVTVDDGTAHWIDLGRSAARLNVACSVTGAVAQARAARGRTELPPGSYQVVLGAEATGELLGFLPDVGFSGALAAAGIGITARAGQQLASPLVDVADDGGADVGLPIGFDIEGVTKRRVPFFTAGRVGEPVTDLVRAAGLGRPSTGHAHIAREQVPEPTAANIVMAGGACPEEELIAQVERGVYLQRFWYTRLVDRVAGTITGVTRDACFLIEDGRLTTPLNGMRFTESVLGVLAGVQAAGCDVKSQPVMNVWNGSVSAPARPRRVLPPRRGPGSDRLIQPRAGPGAQRPALPATRRRPPGRERNVMRRTPLAPPAPKVPSPLPATMITEGCWCAPNGSRRRRRRAR